MNKLVEEIIKPILESNSKIKKVVGIYGGRFQPFGPHHYKTYKWLEKQVDEAYITTSNIKKPPRHPMNFKEKVRHMSKMGVPSSKIVEEKTPYVAKNVQKKFNSETTAFVYIFGKKDAGRLKGGTKKSGGKTYYQDFKKNKNNLEGYETHGYILTAPHVSISVGGKEVSGTSMRELLGSSKIDDSERAKLFKKMFGYFDKGIFTMLTNKFKKLFEGKLTEAKEYPIWGIPPGKRDEELLYTKAKSHGEAKKILKILISKHGIKKGRIQVLDLEQDPSKFWKSDKVFESDDVMIFKPTKIKKVDKKKWHDGEGYELLHDLEEDINIPIKVGDTVLVGKFKNKKEKVKSIGKDKHGMPTINGRKATTFRIHKRVNIFDEDIDTVDKDGKDGGEYRTYKKNDSEWDEPSAVNEISVTSYAGKLGGYKGFKEAPIDNIKKSDNPSNKEPQDDRDMSKKQDNEKINKKQELTLTKEYVADFLTTIDFKKLINEVTSTYIASEVGDRAAGQSMVDDGPNAFLGGMGGYTGRNNTSAEKLGFEVINYILDVDVSKVPPFKSELDNDRHGATYMPAGVGTGITANNPFNLTGGEAYKKWQKHIKNVAQTVGMEMIKYINTQDKDIEQQISKDTKQTLKQQKKEEKPESKKKDSSDGSGKIKESFSKEWWKEQLLTEGGAYGHMAHPFDDKDLTFGDLKKIIENGLGGQLNREDNVTEKLDGQNIMISWKDGKLIAARNKGHIKNGGKTALDAKGIASKFKGRGEIANAFNFAMKDLEKSIKGLSQKQKDKIFNNGYNFMNMEVMWPKSANVIDYDVATLIFHGALKYDDKGNVIGEVPGSGRILAGMIQQINQHIQKKYSIGKPVFLEVPKHQDFGKMKEKFLSRLSKLQTKFGMKDSDELALYHQYWWSSFIKKKDKNIPFKVLKGLIQRWAFFDKSYSVKDMKNDIKDEKFLEWVLKFDKQDHAKQVKENMRPFEVLFFEVGAEILKNVRGFIAANPNKAVQNMKKKLDAAITDVRKGGDLKKLNRLKVQLDRLNAIGGTKAIVPSEGIVFKYKGKTYKFTGAFAPVNQITGLISF